MEEMKMEGNNEQIKDFIENLKIKTVAMGGYSKEDVHACIEQLCEMYEGKLGALQQQLQAAKAQIQAQSQSDSDSAGLTQPAGGFDDARVKALEEENAKLKSDIQDAREERDMITAVMMDARRNSDNIIKEAEKKAETIIEDTNNETERMIQQRNDILDKLRNENVKYIQYIEGLKEGLCQIEDNLDQLKETMINIDEPAETDEEE